ncbi:M18 family aminopeptidase [uncultured Acetatifactor sp.]|uniref:M18 family aminopeptidase n=1 Tax=uncultured Acetatifactor sp. TaxID=1671927 RepID=UPI0026231F62|nr:M18 family aminopeptidase [uncultured Acetatifactor sp.]
MNMKEYQRCAKEMLEFIEKSPTAYHAVANLKEEFANLGFRELKETDQWELEPGHGYYVARNDSALIAFRIPQGDAPKGFHISAAHADSPTFKIKESPEMAVEGAYLKLNTEKYGGMILSAWLDRPLSVAGRVVVRGKAGCETRLVNIEKDLMVIPSVAIHMNRDTGKGGELNPQTDMLPLYGECSDGKKDNVLLRQVARAVGVKQEDILGHDLFLYVRDKGRLLGESGEFVLSPRLDDLQCVYASARGFTESAPGSYINVCAVFDNEEVGSGTKQGANSTFLEDVLWRIGEGMGLGRSGFLRMIAGSFLISADNAHAVHPNHPEKADPTNKPYLNRGIVIKFHGSQKYATDAVSAARMREICEKAEVPCQTYANRSDIAGGSTLGNISTAHVSVSTVDIGLPQLAMHSAVETAGVKDTKYAVEAFRVFFSE